MDVFLERLKKAEVLKDPFPHFVMDDALPREEFIHLRDILFRNEKVLFIEKPKRYHIGRAFAEISDEIRKEAFRFWNVEHLNEVLKKFGLKMPSLAEQGWQASEDKVDYQLVPHIDDNEQILSLIFYMEGDYGDGTAMFTPKNPEFKFTDNEHRHFPFDDFNLVKVIPFKSNTVFGFAWGPDTWHGVAPVHQHRGTVTWVLKKKC